MEKTKYYVASFSGGKDSTAMVLHLIEIGKQIDEVIFCDTTMEFPAMLRHVEKVKKVVEDAGIKFTTLRSEKSFEHLMFDEKCSNKDTPGRGWPTFKIRWCTGEVKKDIIKKYFKKLNNQYEIIQYVGIAADEGYRLSRISNQKKGQQHPLVEWGWSEETCLKYCYDKGYDWEGLYTIYSRVSCWCCPLKSLGELRKLRKYHPELWVALKGMDERAWNQFRADYSVADLEQRFALEDELTKQDYSITNRAFHTDLKRLLAGETAIEEVIQEREAQQKIL